MKKLILLAVTLLSLNSFAGDIVCLVKQGEKAEDVAFLLRLDENQALFLQGSKAQFLRTKEKKFSGLSIKIDNLKIYDEGATKLFVKGTLLKVLKHDLTLFADMTALNIINGEIRIYLDCKEYNQLEIEILH